MSKEKFVRHKPHVLVVTIIIITSLLSAFSLGIVGYVEISNSLDLDNDTISDKVEERMSLPTYFQAQNDRLEYSTFETTNTSGNHEIGHYLGLLHAGPSNLLEMHSYFFDDVSTALPILEFRWQYNSLLEFIDTDGNGFFNPEEDSVIAQVPLTNMTRVNFGFGLDGQPVYFSEYLSNDGKLALQFYHAREHVLLGRQVGLLAPGELKSYLVIDDYIPVTGGANVAINITMSSNQDLVLGDTYISATVGDYNSEYHWHDEVIRDGVKGLANATVLSTTSGNNAALYINLGSFTRAEYDPHYYVNHPPTRSSSSSAFTSFPWSYVTIGSFIPLIISTVVLAVRKRPGRVTF